MDPKDEPKSTLTPPASEEADKHDDSGSELSELELESDDNVEIVPDHYYDGGKVPVFKPVSTHIFSIASHPWETIRPTYDCVKYWIYANLTLSA